jgi:hypothetical protein
MLKYNSTTDKDEQKVYSMFVKKERKLGKNLMNLECSSSKRNQQKFLGIKTSDVTEKEISN